MENEAHINYLGEGQWNVPLPDKNSRILPVWTLSRPLTNNLLISSETKKKFVNNHRQKHVEITKDCLWNELQNHCVESTEKKNSLSVD